MSISIQFPMEIGPEGYKSYTDDQTSEAIDQNLKFLLLTLPGTFFDEPSFGAGIQRFIFEFGTQDVLQRLTDTIASQATIYLPYITILNINSSIDEMTLNTKIQYRIDQTSEVKFFELTTEA